MNIFERLFGKPKLQDVFQMAEDPDRFIAELSKRKLWRDIDHALLAEIAVNAKELAGITGKAEARFLKGFVFVSECYELLQNNLLPSTRNQHREKSDPPLASLASALYGLGASLSDAARSLTDAEQLPFVAAKADMAFSSAIICDRYHLPSYASMAFLYGTIVLNKDFALQWCRHYRCAEAKLLSASDQSLTWNQRGLKELLTHPVEARNIANKILGAVTEEEVPAMREMIGELERALLHPQ
jgi:hypothetical protein